MIPSGLPKRGDKEEKFTFIHSEKPISVDGLFCFSISVMEDEHESAGDALRRLRQLTDDYRVPEGACNTWIALWHGLAALEEDMHQHIHLENNILFPRSQAD